jgi:hypothetical protein
MTTADPMVSPARRFVVVGGSLVGLSMAIALARGATPGHRRLNMVWYDPARSELLSNRGLLDGATVHGTLGASDVPGPVRQELETVAHQRWPSPWREATELALHRPYDVAALAAGFPRTPGRPATELLADYQRQRLADARAHVEQSQAAGAHYLQRQNRR